MWSDHERMTEQICFCQSIKHQASVQPNVLIYLGKGPISFGFTVLDQHENGYYTGPHGKLIIHDQNDAISSGNQHYEYIFFGLNRFSKYLNIRKSKFSSVSTLQNPCSIQGYDACRKNELETGYDILATEHKCHIPIALKRKIGQSPHLPVCDNNVTLEAIRLGKEESKCQKLPQCQYSKYLVKSRPTDKDVFWHFEIAMDENIEVHESFITYGAVNLIGDLGGTMGMCLGWSAFYFIEKFLIHFFSKTSYMQNKNIVVMLLLSLFLFWSSYVVNDYINETESMELVVENKIYPPVVTVCRMAPTYVGMDYQTDHEYSFMNWLHETHDCSKGKDDKQDRHCSSGGRHTKFLIAMFCHLVS